MKGPEVGPQNPQKSQVLVFEISVLVRQRVMYLWDSLDSQPGLLGKLMASERALQKKKKKRRYIYSDTHVACSM